MNHAEAKQQLAIYRYLGQEERAEVDRHVRQCAECGEWQRSSQVIDRELAAMSLPMPGRGVRERFYHSIGKEGERKLETGSSGRSGALPAWATQLAGLTVILLTVALIWAGFELFAGHQASPGTGPLATVTPTRAAGTADDTAPFILKWRKQDGPSCRTLALDKTGAASFGPCAGPLKTGQILPEVERQQDLKHFMDDYQAFEADTAAGRIALTGEGSRSAGPAEQRALAQWAELVYQELDAGRSGASWGMALALNEESPQACMRIQIEFYGKVMADDCRNGIQSLPNSWLSESQLETLDGWMKLHNFELDWNEAGTAVRLVTGGRGDPVASDAEQQAIKDWALNLYGAILKEQAEVVPTSTPARAFTATPAPQPPAVDPKQEFALQVGNLWVYQSTRYEGFNAGDVITATGTVTRTIVDSKSDPTFYAAKIREETSAEVGIGGPADLQKQLLRAASSAEYWLVLSGNRIYRETGEPDLSKLKDNDYLEFVLPLATDARWLWLPPLLPGSTETGGIYRQVMQQGSVQVPAGRFDNCYLIHNGWNTDTSNSWFCPGTGYVEEKSDHNGTPMGSRLVLVQYQQASSPARGALDRFMEARIARDETTLMSLLTDRLRAQVNAGSVPPSLIQVSNPCWYRYSILSVEMTTPTKAKARVRVYQHDWAGDNAGGLPRSWEQDIVLLQVGNDWRVDQVGEPQNEKQEPDEPHGPTLSACSAGH